MFTYCMNRVKRIDSTIAVIYSLASHTVYHIPMLLTPRPQWFVEIREHEIIVRNTEMSAPDIECLPASTTWNRVLCTMENSYVKNTMLS